jgi:hypothetical protein
MADDAATIAREQAARDQQAAKEREGKAREQIKKQNEDRQRMVDEGAAATAEIKPTPTQEENDLAAMGVPVPEHEPDGSPVEGEVPTQQQRKQMEGQRGQPYTTRAVPPPKPPA